MSQGEVPQGEAGAGDAACAHGMPALALDLSPDAIRLLRRDGGPGWTEIARAEIDREGSVRGISRLRVAAGGGPGRPAPEVAVLMPPDQVLVRRLRLPGDAEARRTAAFAAVTAATGQPAEALAVAVSAERADGARLVLAIYRQSYREAAAYAEGWGFRPVLVGTTVEDAHVVDGGLAFVPWDAREALGPPIRPAAPEAPAAPSRGRRTRALAGLLLVAAAAVAVAALLWPEPPLPTEPPPSLAAVAPDAGATGPGDVAAPGAETARGLPPGPPEPPAPPPAAFAAEARPVLPAAPAAAPAPPVLAAAPAAVGTLAGAGDADPGATPLPAATPAAPAGETAAPPGTRPGAPPAPDPVLARVEPAPLPPAAVARAAGDAEDGEPAEGAPAGGEPVDDRTAEGEPVARDAPSAPADPAEGSASLPLGARVALTDPESRAFAPEADLPAPGLAGTAPALSAAPRVAEPDPAAAAGAATDGGDAAPAAGDGPAGGSLDVAGTAAAPAPEAETPDPATAADASTGAASAEGEGEGASAGATAEGAGDGGADAPSPLALIDPATIPPPPSRPATAGAEPGAAPTGAEEGTDPAAEAGADGTAEADPGTDAASSDADATPDAPAATPVPAPRTAAETAEAPAAAGRPSDAASTAVRALADGSIRVPPALPDPDAEDAEDAGSGDAGSGDASAEEDEAPTALAALATPAPRARPEGIGAPIRPTRAGEARPTKTLPDFSRRVPLTVERAARDSGIPLESTSLIGVLNLDTGRQALIRMPDGKYHRIGVGDDVEGWKVISITPNRINLRRAGTEKTLVLVAR